MIFEQEELDWEVYRLYGLIDERPDLLRRLTVDRTRRSGERAFEIALARRVAAATRRRRGSPGTARRRSPSCPTHWPADYRTLVQRRLELIESDPVDPAAGAAGVQAALGGRRRGTRRSTSALRGAILDRLESAGAVARRPGRRLPRSVAELADARARRRGPARAASRC